MAGKRPIPIDEPRCYDWTMWDTGYCNQGKTVVQFRDNKLVLFDAGGRVPDDNDKKRFQDIQRKTYQGKMTRGAQKRMSKSLCHLSQISPQKWKLNPVTGKLFLHQLSFVTLTISAQENIEARDAFKKLLRPFLDWLRKTHGCKNYVWKLELQQRGQIHYHLALPIVLHWRAVRHKWNRLQVKAGYLDAYAAKHGHADANSTDIHTMSAADKGTDYLMKELGKDADSKVLQQKRSLAKQLQAGHIDKETHDRLTAELDEKLATVRGKVWDCSEALNDPYYFLQMTNGLYQKLKLYLQRCPAAFTIGERFCMVSINYAKPPPWFKCYLPGLQAHNYVINSGGIRAIQKKYYN